MKTPLYHSSKNEKNSFVSLSEKLGVITNLVASTLTQEGYTFEAQETSLTRADYFYSKGSEHATLTTHLSRHPLEARAEISANEQITKKIKKALEEILN
ncbi:hypothetical protein D6817_02800 [Candidatus Pacearchaeota archaeon]|nr:MAG: hypothetical protein D6817_02800 [Candidatus Pacearchaeota archaeon]